MSVDENSAQTKPQRKAPKLTVVPSPNDDDGRLKAGLLAVGMIGERAATSWGLWIGIFVTAFVVHGVIGVTTYSLAKPKKMEERVTMAIVETPPPPPPPPPPEPEAEKPPEPEKPKQKLKDPPKVAEVTPPPPTNSDPPPEDTPVDEPPPIVTGISMSSTVSSPNGMKVRVGNTAFGDPNKEKFTDPKDVKAYTGGKVQKEFKPTRASAVTTQAGVKTRPKKPRFPRDLLDMGIEGKVLLTVEVGKDGTTRSVTVKKGLHPVLDKLAVENVKQFTWSPAEVDGVPVDTRITYAFNWEVID